jgi:hypothetical protein
VLIKDPDDLVKFLASFPGFSEVLVNASRLNLGDYVSIPLIFALAIIIGPIPGIVGLLTLVFLIYKTNW